MCAPCWNLVAASGAPAADRLVLLCTFHAGVFRSIFNWIRRSTRNKRSCAVNRRWTWSYADQSARSLRFITLSASQWLSWLLAGVWRAPGRSRDNSETMETVQWRLSTLLYCTFYPPYLPNLDDFPLSCYRCCSSVWFVHRYANTQRDHDAFEYFPQVIRGHHSLTSSPPSSELFSCVPCSSTRGRLVAGYFFRWIESVGRPATAAIAATDPSPLYVRCRE